MGSSWFGSSKGGRKKDDEPAPNIEEALRKSEETIDILRKKIEHDEAMEKHHQTDAQERAQAHDRTGAEMALRRVHAARNAKTQTMNQLAAVTRQYDMLKGAESQKRVISTIRMNEHACDTLMTPEDTATLEAVQLRAQEYSEQMAQGNEAMQAIASIGVTTSDIDDELNSLMAKSVVDQIPVPPMHQPMGQSTAAAVSAAQSSVAFFVFVRREE
eukprot:Selendium_serpulae@DN6331_c5_g1_i4.p2